MRTLVDLPEDQIKNLDQLAEKTGISRAEAIRRAVAKFLQDKTEARTSAFGILKNCKVDGLKLQKSLREDR